MLLKRFLFSIILHKLKTTTADLFNSFLNVLITFHTKISNIKKRSMFIGCY